MVNYRADLFFEFAELHSTYNFTIEVVEESEPLGTAGALAQLKPRIDKTFLCIYGDVLGELDLDRLAAFHLSRNADLTLVVHPNDHPYDSDLVRVSDYDSRVTEMLTKPHPKNLTYRNLVNAAVYVVEPQALALVPNKKGDLARDVFPDLVKELKVFAYNTPEYLKDMGTPSRYQHVEKALMSDQLRKRSLRTPRKTVFVDRDGVICRLVDQLSRVEDFELNEGVSGAIKRLNESGHLVVVVTNQPMIAKGFLTFDTLSQIHQLMETRLGDEGAWVDRVYFCPHHPEKGHPGEVEHLKIFCDCRKPGIGLFQQAQRDFNIDVPNSWMIGDSWRDIKAGQAFGLQTVGIFGSLLEQDLVEKGIDISNMLAAENLSDAVNKILESDN